MSYCVHCGVELDESAATCALCATPVYNPNRPPADVPAPYSEKIVLPPPVRRRFTAFIASMVMLLPNLVCLLTNLLFPIEGGMLAWAKYVNTTSLLLWIIFVFPFLWKRVRAYALVPLDSGAILLYIYFFYRTFDQQTAEQNWFTHVALPVVLVLAVFATATIEWCTRKKRDWPNIFMLLFMEVGVYAVVLELSLDVLFTGKPDLSVSLVVFVSCVAIAIFFAAVKRNRRLRAWLSRNFFF